MSSSAARSLASHPNSSVFTIGAIDVGMPRTRPSGIRWSSRFWATYTLRCISTVGISSGPNRRARARRVASGFIATRSPARRRG